MALSQIQRLKQEFKRFKKDTIRILEEINNYNFDRDVLGTERVKSRRIKALIKSLKGE